jgi:hypothetical protein
MGPAALPAFALFPISLAPIELLALGARRLFPRWLAVIAAMVLLAGLLSIVGVWFLCALSDAALNYRGSGGC